MARKQGNGYSTSTLAQARTLVQRTATDYRAWSDQEGSKTQAAAIAVREARHSGYLHTGPASERSDDQVTQAGLAGMFGVTRANVTWWAGLATALDVGISTDSDDWTMLCDGKAIRNPDVAGAVKADRASVTSIRKALKAAGYKVTTTSDGVKRTERITRQGQGPRQGQTDQQADAANGENAGETPVDPFTAGKDALVALGNALKALRVSDDTREQWEVLRRNLVEIVRREDTHRMPEGERVFAPSRKARKAA